MEEKELKKLALIMSINCVRNTIIEDFHGDNKISDYEMMNFNKEVSNKMYTFLHYLFHENSEESNQFISMASMFYPINWDEPKLDDSFIEAMKTIKKRNI